MKPLATMPMRSAALVLALALLPGCGPTRPVVPGASDAQAVPAPARAYTWSPIGHSVEGRPLLVSQQGSGALRIYLIGGVHGDETEGLRVIESARQAAAPGATIRILRDLNPDGSAAGERHNARGLDLNRNWPARNFDPASTGGPTPLSEPETRAVAADLRAFKPTLVVVLHSLATGGPLVNYDGPAAELAAAFADAARSPGYAWYAEPDIGYPTTGSLGSYLGIDQGIPILTVEFQRGQDAGSTRAALERGMAAVIHTASARKLR